MRNRAKCKLCDSLIESYFKGDVISCDCGEITIDGGPDCFGCWAKNFANFLRVDDEDNLIEVTYIEEKASPQNPEKDLPKLSKLEKLDMLREMIKIGENLPSQALQQPITHYDFYSALSLIFSILAED